MQRLDDYINRVKNLPPAPRALPPLLALLGQPDVDSDRVVQLIAWDPALTAGVLRICNNAYFGAARQVTDLQEAVTRIGFNQIYQMVLAIVGEHAMFPAQKSYGIDEGELWKHTVTAALAAKLLARETGGNEDVVFTAAILHDVGKIVLAQALEQSYADVLQEIERHQCSLLETETRLLGAHHAEVGGRLLARWNFPANLVTAVSFHHEPALAQPHETLASCVYLGNMIAYLMGYGYGHAAFAMRCRAEALEILGVNASDLPRFMIRTFEGLDSLRASLGIKT